MTERHYRAGQSVEDHCRACHEDRAHTVIVVDANRQPLRVSCDFCRSEHNYRGGPRAAAGPAAAHKGGPYSALPHNSAPPHETTAILSQRERKAPPMAHSGTDDLEMLIRTIIREEIGLTPVTPSDKWRGGQMVLKPGKPGLQEKTWPIETFFNKVVMLRNRLRTLEQQINASELPDDQKLKLQGYITGCYGSLTSFNVLFAEEDDRFVGSGGGD